MTEAVGAFGSEIGPSDAWGMVSFGNLVVSARDVAAFMMMYRSYVLREVGNTRTDAADQHLNHIKDARGYYGDLVTLDKYSDTDPSFGRLPITPGMKQFLQDAEIADPSYETNIFIKVRHGKYIPPSVLEYLGLEIVDDKLIAHDRAYEEFNLESFEAVLTDGGTIFELKDVVTIHDKTLETTKQNINNYIDLLSEQNNLFMTKFRAVINNMNTALEGANTQVDKANDLSRNIWNNW